MIVYVLTYENHLCEEWEVRGVFSDDKKVEKLLAEHDAGERDSLYIEPWELNMTHLEKNIRGMIRNLEKTLARDRTYLDKLTEANNPVERKLVRAEIEFKERMILRLEGAFRGTHAEDE